MRRELQRRDPELRPPTYEPDLFRARPASLCCAAPTIPQTPTRSISIASSRLIPVSEPRGTFSKISTSFNEAEDLDGANQALGRFADLYATGQTPEYHNIVDTIMAWGEEILAYHTTRGATNEPIEGINNLLQVLRRVAGAEPSTPPAPVVAVPPKAVTRITCGYRRSHHATVDEVRACSARS